MAGAAVVSRAAGETGDDVCRRSGLGGISDLLDGPVVVVSVVERDPEEQHREHNTDEAGEVKPDDALQEPVHSHVQEDGADYCGDVSTPCSWRPSGHRFESRTVRMPMMLANRPNAHITIGKRTPFSPKTGKSATPRIIAPIFSAAVDSKRSAPRPAQSPTLSPTRSATTAGFRNIVFRNARLNFAYEVCTDIGGLSIDTAAKLGKECDK